MFNLSKSESRIFSLVNLEKKTRRISASISTNNTFVSLVDPNKPAMTRKLKQAQYFFIKKLNSCQSFQCQKTYDASLASVGKLYEKITSSSLCQPFDSILLSMKCCLKAHLKR